MTEDQQTDADRIIKPITDHWGPVCEAVAQKTGWSVSEIMLHQIYCAITNLRPPYSKEFTERLQQFMMREIGKDEEWHND